MPTDSSDAHDFYRDTIETLSQAGMPYLVGGGYALRHYTGLLRDPKDFDIFVRREEYDAVMNVLSQAGYHTELTFPHWLGKASCEHGYMDVIFNSGNGVARVDEAWFEYATPGHALGVAVKFCAMEEIIWSKAYIMERERYDAADIMHLIRTHAENINWPPLLGRFGDHCECCS